MTKPEVDLRKMRDMTDEEVTEYLREWAIYGLQSRAGYIPQSTSDPVDKQLDATLDRLPDADDYIMGIPMTRETDNDKRIFHALKYLKARAFDVAFVHLKNLARHGSEFFKNLL